MYVELHAASAFSFLEAASLPETLIDRAVELGYPALALLDRDGVYGAPRFHLAAKAAGVKAIIGAELTIRCGAAEANTLGVRDSGFGIRDCEPRQNPVLRPRHSLLHPDTLWHLPVLVESQAGYRNLCRLVTTMKMRSPKGEGALSLDELEGRTGGLIALAGRAALAGSRFGVGGLLDRLVGIFGRSSVYVELQRHLLRDEESDNHALLDLGSAFHVPVVATNGVRFATRAERPLYDVLTCIRHKTTLDRAGRRLARNAERYLKPPEEMARLFGDLPQAVAGTRTLADRLQYTMADLGYRFPDYPVPAGETMVSFLRKITDAGARERYRPYHERARRQIERELDLIEKLDLAGYFLIVWDIVNFCRQHDILVQGRGSAANSAVCYSLGITAVDPVGMDLLFERFLSEERGEWPDIDLDLPSGDRRERAIQHIYEKYGRLGAAMTANVITYRGRSAAREVGKTLSIEPDQIDRLAKVMNNFEWIDPNDTLARHLRDAGFSPDDSRLRLFGELWQRIQHLPRHLGQHSGGMVICQGRLDEVVPLENATMPGRVVIQWDKDDCADMGIVKVDLLGLGMMAVLQDALEMVNRPGRHDPGSDAPAARGLPGAERVDLAHLPPDDPVVYRMLQDADTIGIFQVESRAQMATLPRLRPARFYDLVVQVAIIRPGPIVGQMVHPYLKRRAGREPVTYPHPSLEPILARTLGVPLFQEQLLRMAMVAAGFSGGEAEELRRAFGFKRSEERMRKVEAKLRDGMARQGIVGRAADDIIRSITSFALYGFPESHAASFALLVYASAYLKAYFPAAFYAAMLNNQPMGFYHPATLVKDAQRRGVRFACIDVQTSDWLCRVEEDGTVRLGLRYVTGLRDEVGKRIEAQPPRFDAQHCCKNTGGVSGFHLRAELRRTAGASAEAVSRTSSPESRSVCPKCGCDDPTMLEVVQTGHEARGFCSTCAHDWDVDPADRLRQGSGGGRDGCRFRSIEALIACTGLRRDELATLAEVGALNAFGYDRRTALWQIERAIRPAGELFEALISPESQVPSPEPRVGSLVPSSESLLGCRVPSLESLLKSRVPGPESLPGPESRVRSRAPDPESLPSPESRVPSPGSSPESRVPGRVPSPGSLDAIPRSPTPDPRPPNPDPRIPNPDPSPLLPMTPEERLVADYAGTGLTIGPHPMAFRRHELALRGVLRAADLPRGRNGRRVRVAGAVITRQRPGTAKGFVFLTLEDETGIANIIVRPDLFTDERVTIVQEPFLLVEGTLQIQDGVTSVKAERVHGLRGSTPDIESHDFY